MAGYIPTFWIILVTYHLYFPSASGLTCFQCNSTARGDCSQPEADITSTVPCDVSCYLEVTSSFVSRGCGNCSNERTCCSTDLCNDYPSQQPTTPPPGAVECYDCHFRQIAGGTTYGNPSCTWEEFDPLHPLVKTKMCSTGCFVSEVTAEEDDDDEREYVLVRGCADLGTCHEDCLTDPGYRSCSSCCHDNLCNGRRIGSVEATSPSNQCYSCTYSAHPGDSIGSPGCYTPFNASERGIQKVTCSGLCKLTVISDETTVAVQRSCSPDCQPSCEELGDSQSCVYCCTGSLCNTAPTLSDLLRTKFWIKLNGLATLVLLFVTSSYR